jgi:hypothetical protein
MGLIYFFNFFCDLLMICFDLFYFDENLIDETDPKSKTIRLWYGPFFFMIPIY